MKLDEAFNYMLTANTKGLQFNKNMFSAIADDIKDVVEEGDLAALKKKVAELRVRVGIIDKLVDNIEAKMNSLTKDEKGSIIDLSVPPDKRKVKGS